MSQQNIVKLSKTSHLELFWSLTSGAIGVGIGIAIGSWLGWI
jgi:hypothetical protein